MQRRVRIVRRTAFCQISGCLDEASQEIDSIYHHTPQVRAAMLLLGNLDETSGQTSLSVIGPLAKLEGVSPTPAQHASLFLIKLPLVGIDEALALPEDRVLVSSGFARHRSGTLRGPPDNRRSVPVLHGSCFFVLTVALPILEAATGGRVSPYRLWRLVMIQRRANSTHCRCLDDVDYGAVKDYLVDNPWVFGNLSEDDIASLEDRGSPQEIAEILRREGYWMWMRPDRFPTETTKTSPSFGTLNTIGSIDLTVRGSVARLPTELLHFVVLQLKFPDLISLASTSKQLYARLLGSPRDYLAKEYIRIYAPWYLPHGEVEMSWWNERNGNAVLGWDYLRRCVSESHSMRNRKRIWRACESIEYACERARV